MAPKAKRKPRWYFSFRSPYSWLAYEDLTTRYPDVAAAIDWVPFWEPDTTSQRLLTDAGGQFPYVPMSKEKHRYILQDVRRLAAERDLSFAWPVDRQPCWEVAHLGYLVAQQQGAGREYIKQVYKARWQLGKNISDRAVIAEVARELELSESIVAGAADIAHWRAAGMQPLLQVYKDGVFGVPFFLHGFDKYWGLDRLPAFVDAVRGDGAAVPEPHWFAEETGGTQQLVPAGDYGHAGGCG